MTSRASAKALAFICFLRWITHVLARNCCYSDACNGNRICAKTGKKLTDSCPARYTVKGDCSLRRNCCFRDHCDKKRICADVTNVLTDSCRRSYSVKSDCSLNRHCCYMDACNKKRICADAGQVLTDSCPRSYTVLESCSLRGHCCYLDACNRNRICADVGKTLVDSCPRSYTVQGGCVLRRQCCYLDACNKKRICADEGEVLRDSCPRSYDVKQNCALELSRSPMDHSPGPTIAATEDGSSVENGDAQLEESLSGAGGGSSKVCRSNVLEPSLACGCGRFLNLFEEGDRWKPLEKLCLMEYDRVSDSGSLQCDRFMTKFARGGSVSASALQLYFAAACKRCFKSSKCPDDSMTERMSVARRARGAWRKLCFILAARRRKPHTYCTE